MSAAAARPFLDLPPLLTAAGSVRLPGSKSISNRALLLAALSSGETRLRGLLASDDTEVMLDALRTLGCGVQVDGDDRSDVRIVGLGGQLCTLRADLFLGNSGTSMRSLTAALALLAATQGGEFTVSGVPRMHERPIADLVDALRPVGCRITYLGAADCPPLRLGDGHVHRLSLDAPIRVGGAISSQFLTGLLLALPLVAQERDVVIEVDGDLVSRPYIAITLDLLARFGVDLVQDEWQRFTVPRGARFVSPGEFAVEGDASSASYFIALGAIAARPEAPLRIDGVGAGSVQGDVRFVDAARAMGADVTLDSGGMTVARGAWPLRSIDIDCNDIPDAAMTLAVMALYAAGTTRLRNIGSWRVKETDRIAAMACELRKLGATVDEGADWIAVTAPTRWQPAAIATYDDHRIAMCASLAAFNGLAGATPPVPLRILDPGCVAKTFPTYFDVLWTLVDTDPALVPVITIDGPTASGKGTVATVVAAALGYHVLDSGAAYRATALAALSAGIDAADAPALALLAAALPVRFDGERILLDGVDVTSALRDEAVGAMASVVSVHPAVRQALLALQLSFRRPPGLVADGRDMGTVVFPDAALKVFLTASVEMRAARRLAQLQARGEFASIDDLREAMEARDLRDRARSASPLVAADDAVMLDNSSITVDEAANSVLSAWQRQAPYDTALQTQS